MRIVWKDTPRSKDYHYRGYTLSRFQNGWVIDHPIDDNIYYSLDCAYNAIDQILCGSGRNGTGKYRQNKGITIIGTKK